MNAWQNIEPLTVLLEERKCLLGIAYRILGSRLAADEAVQETYAQWYAMRGSEIWSPRVWLHNKLTYVCQSRAGCSVSGPLDDVMCEEGGTNPPTSLTPGQHFDVGPGEAALQALQEAVSLLTPQERASLLSGEPAGNSHCESGSRRRQPLASELVAEIARQSLRSFNAGHVTAEQRQAVVRELRVACESGDLRLMASVLAPDVSAVFDGGGKIRAPDHPISGVRNVTRCLGTFLSPSPGITIVEHGVNGQPGLVVRLASRVVAVISVDVHDDHVINAWLVLNPDKLIRWNKCRDELI